MREIPLQASTPGAIPPDREWSGGLAVHIRPGVAWYSPHPLGHDYGFFGSGGAVSFPALGLALPLSFSASAFCFSNASTCADNWTISFSSLLSASTGLNGGSAFASGFLQHSCG